MALADQFNPEAVAQELIQPFHEGMQQSGIPADEIQTNTNIAFEFAKIAGSLILQEPGFKPPNSDQFLPFDEKMARLCIQMFLDGVYHAAMKCWEYGIVGDLKSQLLQSLAQDVFFQSKQLVASTYGQEDTPEIQFSQQQLKEWTLQAAESILMHYISEFEKQYGPIQQFTQQAQAAAAPEQAPPAQAPAPPPPTEPPAPAAEAPIPPPPTEAPAPAVTQPEPPPQAPAPSPVQQPPATLEAAPVLANQDGSIRHTPYDKYAAVALFLSTLPGPRADRFLKQFGEAERQAILAYYEKPELIENELDVRAVTAQLEALCQRMAQQRQEILAKESPGQRKIKKLLKTTPVQRVIHLIQPERPLLQQMVMHQLGLPDMPTEPVAFSRKLDEVVAAYLQQQL
ncbi:MAG: hypothetical protein SFZ03_11090 [Candidatus Melainabacteria bacterium]|nr:hypothetical protein [Candidatus Melainabacteria bacterium]